MSKEQGMGSKIRAVVFDFGGVLMRTVNPVPPAAWPGAQLPYHRYCRRFAGNGP
jgi:hypothetical protein